MCFSAEASFIAAAVLVPTGLLTMMRAYNTDGRYLPIASLPLLFGLPEIRNWKWGAATTGKSKPE